MITTCFTGCTELAATVTVAPTGEVILVCAENHDTLLANIEKALAA